MSLKGRCASSLVVLMCVTNQIAGAGSSRLVQRWQRCADAESDHMK